MILILIHYLLSKTLAEDITLAIKDKINLSLIGSQIYTVEASAFVKFQDGGIQIKGQKGYLVITKTFFGHILKHSGNGTAVYADVDTYSLTYLCGFHCEAYSKASYSDRNSMFCYVRTKKNNIGGQRSVLDFNNAVVSFCAPPLKALPCTGQLPYSQTHSVYLDGPNQQTQNIQIIFTKNNLTRNSQSGSVELSYMFYTNVSYSTFFNNSVDVNRQEYMVDDNGKIGFLYQSQQNGQADVSRCNFLSCKTKMAFFYYNPQGGNPTKWFYNVYIKDSKWDNFYISSYVGAFNYNNVVADGCSGSFPSGVISGVYQTVNEADAASLFDCEALDSQYGSNTIQKPTYSFCPTSKFSPSSRFTTPPPTPPPTPLATLSASPFPTLSASPLATISASQFPTLSTSPLATFCASPFPTLSASPLATFCASPFPTLSASPP
jgi:hypothetical protein